MYSYNAYFFDFDGTIGETGADIRESWSAVIQKLDLPREHFENHFQIGPTPMEFLNELFPDMPTTEKKYIFEAYKSFYDDRPDYQALPYPGITDMLQQLHDAGKKVYIVTNKRYKPLSKLISQFGYTNLVDGLFSPDISDPENHLKKTDLLALALRISGIPADESLMIGDTGIDIAVGKANHTATCAVTWGYGSRESLVDSAPDHLIESPAELP